MLRLLARTHGAAIRPAITLRSFSTTPRKYSDAGPPLIFGPGSTSGAVPTDEQQSTGLERLQLLGKMEGVDVFNMGTPQASKKGTMQNPIMVASLAKLRFVGCTGSDGEEHRVTWMRLRPDKKGRCTECGNVFAMDYQGEEGEDDHH